MTRRNPLNILFALAALLLAILINAFYPSSICTGQQKEPAQSSSDTGVRIITCSHLFDLTGTSGKKFNQPSAVSVFRDQIYVLDGVNGRVAVFNKKGDPLFEFGKHGTDPGEFKSPLGLYVDYQGRIYVADSGNHRIQIFNQNGTLLNYFTLKEDRYGSPADPTDLLIDKATNRILIVDNDNHRLVIYTTDGRFIKEAGEVGFENGQFRYPYSIAQDDKGLIYIVDVLNTRVQVFDPEGVFLRNIGEWGIEKGQFFRPQGIAVDKQKRIYVTESYEKIGVIQVFTSDGTFHALLGDKSKKKLRFSVPTDICFDDNGRIYVCEMYASRVSVYQIE
ncbi:NHL repeat-containing protein [bacterium]|nr:NHL repeat-containing protein [bacterium]